VGVVMSLELVVVGLILVEVCAAVPLVGLGSSHCIKYHYSHCFSPLK